MEFESIIARAGKPSLYTIVATGKNGLIAKALDTMRPEAVSPAEQVSTLKDISIYVVEGEEPLRNVFAGISSKFEGEVALSHKADMQTLRSSFSEILPNYDAERVYDGDIRKVFKWYNQLVANGFDSAAAFQAKVDDTKAEEAAAEVEEGSTKKTGKSKAKPQ